MVTDENFKVRELADELEGIWHSSNRGDRWLDIARHVIARDAQREAEIRTNANEMLGVQASKGTWDIDPYNHGLYNGMEFMLALFEGREPQFREAPEKWVGWSYDISDDEPITNDLAANLPAPNPGEK